jgi:hypothetical protein
MPGNPMEGKLQGKIDEFINKHYTEDRKWRFDAAQASFRTL